MMDSPEYLERKAHQLRQRLIQVGDQILLKEELLTITLQGQKENIHSHDDLTAYLLEGEVLRRDLVQYLEREENLKRELMSIRCQVYCSPADSSTHMTENELESSVNDEGVASSNSSMLEDSVESINAYEAFKHTARQPEQQHGRATRSREAKAPAHPYDALDDKEINVDGSALNVDSLRMLEGMGWRRMKCPRLIPLQKSSSTIYLPPGQSDILPTHAERNRHYFLTVAAARYYEDGGKFTEER